MKTDTLTLESVLGLYMAAEPKRQQAGLQALAEALTRDTVERPEEARHTLKEISELTRKHVVWLARLKVPELCGEYIGGRRGYKLSQVLDYLRSEACRARIKELNTERKCREQAKNGGAQ